MTRVLAWLRLVPPWFDLHTLEYKSLPYDAEDALAWERYQGKRFPLDGIVWPLVKHRWNAGPSGWIIPVGSTWSLVLGWNRAVFACGFADQQRRQFYGFRRMRRAKIT